MRKAEEVSNSMSCLNRASDNELLFVLLGRDEAAPGAIRYWCHIRVARGKNTWDDQQILEALACAKQMEAEHPNRALKHRLDRTANEENA